MASETSNRNGKGQIVFFPVAGFQGSLEGTTLLCPAPNGLGNIGQLAVDLLIATFSLQKIGFLESPDLLPVCGHDTYDQEQQPRLYTTFEVFQGTISGKQYSVIQIRSPVIKKRAIAFAQDFADWIASTGFKNIVLLSGLDAGRRNDQQMSASRLRHFSTDRASTYREALEKAGIRELEGDVASHASGNPIPPGGGVLRFLIEKLKDGPTPLVCLTWFSVEGDNVNDAVELASAVRNLSAESDAFARDGSTWKIPASWEQLYGPTLTTPALFG
ncbi:PAC2 family-domain-containing protein [Phlyctochytrium arcticum]|nr:PAC2 family-domain-containing protein [Phlyctochytrium arcticum]